MTKNCQIELLLIDDDLIVYLTPIISMIQREKTKCEYPVHYSQIIWHFTMFTSILT